MHRRRVVRDRLANDDNVLHAAMRIHIRNQNFHDSTNETARQPPWCTPTALQNTFALLA